MSTAEHVKVGPLEAAVIVHAASSLGHMVSGGTGWPSGLADALKRISAWSLEYARTSHVDHLHWVVEAESDLRDWMTTHRGYVNPEAGPAIEKAYELAAFVRRCTEPPPTGDPFAVIEAARAAEDGVTVEVIRQQDAEDVARWRSQMSLIVQGVDTDRPTMPGADMLTAAQLRHLAADLLRRAEVKAPTPSPAPSRPAEDGPTGPTWTGQAVA